MAGTHTALPNVARLAVRDMDPLFKLYARETRGLAHCPAARRRQFDADLMTPRFLRGPEHYDPRASIQLVVRSGRTPIAYASGCKSIKGDEVTAPHEGFVRFVLADPTHRRARENVRAMVRGVVRHLRRFKPRKIKAFDYCMPPCFFHLGSGQLPIEWAWIGHCLKEEGFEPGRPAQRLWRPLFGRGFVLGRPRVPAGFGSNTTGTST